MDIFALYNNYVDKFYLEAVNDVENTRDVAFSDIYLEDGTNDKIQKSFIAKLGETIKKFFQKLRDAFNALMKKDTVVKVQEAVEVVEDKNEKIRVESPSSYEKIIQEGDETLKRLDKCKTVEEVEKEMARYRRKIKILKAAAAVTIITIAAAAIYIHKKQKTELEQYKKREIEFLNNVQKLNEQIAKDRTEHAKAMDELRTKIERTNAENLGLKKEVEALQEEKKRAATAGQFDGRKAVLNAQLEVVKDQAQANTSSVGDMITALSQATSVGEAMKIVKNGVNEIKENSYNIAKEGIKSVTKDAKDVHAKGKDLKEKVDKCIKLLKSTKVPDEKKVRVLNWLIDHEPEYKYLSGKYGTMRHDIIAWRTALEKRHVKGLKSIPK